MEYDLIIFITMGVLFLCVGIAAHIVHFWFLQRLKDMQPELYYKLGAPTFHDWFDPTWKAWPRKLPLMFFMLSGEFLTLSDPLLRRLGTASVISSFCLLAWFAILGLIIFSKG